MPTAIFTKYLGYTDKRASRIKAYTAYNGNKPGRSLTVEYNHDHGATVNHERAAHKLADRLAWHGEWIAGDCGDKYVFVRKMIADDVRFTVERGEAKEKAALDYVRNI